MKNTCVIGIDPGLAHCGWGVITVPQIGNPDFPATPKPLHLLGCGEIVTLSSQPLASRLQKIFESLQLVFTQYQPTACAVEELYLSKNSSSALPVAHARGVMLLCAAQHNALVAEFSANRIKQAVTGQGKAQKLQVQQMVALLLGLEPTDNRQPALSSNHAADALAAAICLVHQRGTETFSDLHKPENMWRSEKEAEKMTGSARAIHATQSSRDFDQLVALGLAAQQRNQAQRKVAPNKGSSKTPKEQNGNGST